MPSLDTCHIYRVEGRSDKKMGALRVPDNLDQSRPFQKARSDAAGAYACRIITDCLLTV